MESKICTYSEKNVRLQLVCVQIPGSSDLIIEIRHNRKVLSRYTRNEAMLARYQFAHIVHDLVVLRDSSIMSKLT